MRRLWLLPLCLLVPRPAAARVYTVDDMLKVEDYGQVAIAPRAGLMLFERVGRYDGATEYSLHYFAKRQITAVLAVPLAKMGVPTPLFPQDQGAGYWMAGLSPDGRRLAVFRFARGALSLGVVELSSRTVRWLPQAPDMPAQSARPIWTDGSHLAFIAMTEARLPLFMSLGKAEREDRARLWRLQDGGRSPSVLAVSEAAGPELDRSGRRLVLVDVTDGRFRTLAQGDLIDVSATADGRRLAVMSSAGPVPPPVGTLGIAFSSRRHSIDLVSPHGGASRPRCGDVLPGTMAWNPRGTRLLAVVRKGGSDWLGARYVLIDPEGRCLAFGGAAVPSTDLGPTLGRGWMGDVPVMLIRGADGRARWIGAARGHGFRLPVGPGGRIVGSLPAALLMMEGDRLFRVGLAGTRSIAVGVESVGAADRDPFTTGIRPIATPGPISHFVLKRAGARRFVSVGRAGGMVGSEAIGDGVSVLAAAAGFRILLSRDASGTETLRLAAGGGAGRFVDRINAHFHDIDPLDARMMSAGAPGGALVPGWLYLPRGPGPHPLVVIPYPGMTFGASPPAIDAPDQIGLMDNARFLLAAGYAVLRPGMPAAPSPRGRARAILAQVDAAVDAAVATGLVDPARLGLLGHSFGGYGALVVATLSARYRAVVAADGPYDLAFEHGSMAGADSMRMEGGIPFGHPAWTEGGQGGMASPADPRAFGDWVAASPRRWLGDVRVSVLLVHGELDPVGIDQAEGAFVDLARLGKDVTLLRYYGEGHALYSPANLRDYYRRVLAFFDARIAAGRPNAASAPAAGGDGVPAVEPPHAAYAREALPTRVSGDRTGDVQRHARSHASQLTRTATVR